MASREFQSLIQAVEKLKSGLMNFSAREDGSYTSEELLKCRAFIAFSHAEVEHYLEKVATRILEESAKRWSAKGVYDRVIVTLLAFRRQSEVVIPEDPKSPSKKANISEIISEAFKTQKKVISENNGIKRKNVSLLLCPLGVLPEDLEEVLLIQLDNTGHLRGEMVHKTSQVSLPNIRDPFSGEQQDIDNLIAEVRKFDERLEALGLLSIATVPARSTLPVTPSAGAGHNSI